MTEMTCPAASPTTIPLPETVLGMGPSLGTYFPSSLEYSMNPRFSANLWKYSERLPSENFGENPTPTFARPSLGMIQLYAPGATSPKNM